jgi:hypothetical protein
MAIIAGMTARVTHRAIQVLGKYLINGAYRTVGGQMSDMPTSMISLCQVGRGFPLARWRARVSILSRVIGSQLSLSARFLRNAEPVPRQNIIRCSS